jgi:LPPG:FO 2-phospho-L-lactate transferase
VSPVAGGRAIRGPLGGMMRAARLPVSPIGITRAYRGLVDGMVIDSRDIRAAAGLERLGIAVATADIQMDTMAKSIAVARTAVGLAQTLRRR